MINAPAASRPTMSMRSSLLPKPLKSLAKRFPIVLRVFHELCLAVKYSRITSEGKFLK